MRFKSVAQTFVFWLVAMFALVVSTWNPTGRFSFYHWFVAHPDKTDSLVIMTAFVLLAAWFAAIVGVYKALHAIGSAVVLVLLAAVTYFILDKGLISTAADPLAWLAIILGSFMLAFGLSFAKFRRFMTGQGTVDEAGDV